MISFNTIGAKTQIMKKASLFFFSLLITSLVGAQDTSKLGQFFELLSAENLKPNKTSLIERKGNSVTVKNFSYSGQEYSFIKFDMTNLERIEWLTKKDYDLDYPESSATNTDAEHITLWFKKGTVEHDTYFTSNDKKEYIGKYGETNHVSKCTDCDFVNITLINSELASQAKARLDAYKNSVKD